LQTQVQVAAGTMIGQDDRTAGSTGGYRASQEETILAGYVWQQRNTLCRLRRLARSTDLDDLVVTDRLVQEQQARIEAAADLTASTIDGVLAKLDLWYVEHLMGGEVQLEHEADRLIVSVRRDLARLLA
jgi:hypothetical protein